MLIMPSLLELTPQALSNQIIRISSFFSSFQIDVVDGKFAPNKTTNTAEITAYFTQNPPNYAYPVLDLHCMVNDYFKEVEHIKALSKIVPVRNILLHASLQPDYPDLSSSFPNFTFGMVLNIEDDVSRFITSSIIKIVPVIQIMTVNVGFQEGTFVPLTLNKIEHLRKIGYKGEIFLDGGINEQTLPIVLSQKYLPSTLCVGSYLTKSTDLVKSVSFLKNILSEFSDIKEQGV